MTSIIKGLLTINGLLWIKIIDRSVATKSNCVQVIGRERRQQGQDESRFPISKKGTKIGKEILLGDLLFLE